MNLRYVDNTSLAMRQTKKLRDHLLAAALTVGLSPPSHGDGDVIV
jgi:hypothetical protein